MSTPVVARSQLLDEHILWRVSILIFYPCKLNKKRVPSVDQSIYALQSFKRIQDFNHVPSLADSLPSAHHKKLWKMVDMLCDSFCLLATGDLRQLATFNNSRRYLAVIFCLGVSMAMGVPNNDIMGKSIYRNSHL